MIKIITICLTIFALLSGCASIVSSSTTRLADNITQAILNQNDLETVRSGAPAYLLLIDGLIVDDKNNIDMLLAGSKLYASYVSAFVDDGERARRMAERSLDYARTALCLKVTAVCLSLGDKTELFKTVLAKTGRKDIPVLSSFGNAWSSWIQANASDWNAIADLPKLTALFERLVALDENYDNGSAHIFLGVLSTQLPPILGGKPEKGRAHFERAQELSGGHNLMINVLMAKHYARLVFDQELHDRLLREVLASSPTYPGLTLINTLANQQAGVLLAESSDFF